MAGGQIIGHGRVLIEAEQNVEREVARAKAAFERAMRDMDRKRASMVLDANLAPLQKKLEDAERKVAEYKRKVEEDAELGVDTKAAERNLKRWERELAKRRQARDEVNLSTEKARRQLAALQKLEDDRATAHRKLTDAYVKGEQTMERARARVAEMAKRAAEQEAAAAKKAAEQKAKEAKKAADAAIREAERSSQAEERLRLAAWKEDRKRTERAEREAEKSAAAEIRNAEKIAAAQAREAEKAALAREKEIAAIPRMNRQYAELERRIQKLNQERAKFSRDPQQRVLINLQIDEAVAQMEDLKRRLNAIGRNPPVEVVVHPGRDFGHRMRGAIIQGGRDRGVRGAAMGVGLVVGTQMTAGIARGIRNTIPATLGMLTKLGHGISNMTVRIGPFTATIRQALIGLSLLGPIIIDLVGALGTLVGVVGSATLGIGALTAGFLGGAIPAALGMGLVIKDVAQEFTAAKKATKAYDDAVLKHGKSSDQAAKKLKELRNVMGGVSKTTAQQFRDGQKLGETWDRLTKPAHASVWKLIGNSMEAASDLMPMFAKNTNQAMSEAERGTSKWMKALSDPAGQRVLDTMMDNFRRSIDPTMEGLGQLIGYFGKVGAAASTHLTPLATTFEKWASALNRTADTGELFQRKIDNIVQSAKDVGNVFLASGRFLKAFFGGGVAEGQRFSRTIADTLNSWTRFLNTAQGQENLTNFFREAVSGTKALYHALTPLLTTFVRWATLISPVVSGFLEGAAAVGRFIAAFLRLTGLQGPLSALVTTLGVLWAVGKISAATRAVSNFTKALLGMSAANTAVAASSRAAGAAGVAAAAGAAAGARAGRGGGIGPGALVGAAAAGSVAARSAGQMGKLAKAGSIATKVMSGLGLVTLGVSAPIAGIAVASAAAGFGLYKFATRTREYEKAARAATDATKASGQAAMTMNPLQDQLAQSYLTAKNAALQVSQAEKNVARLRSQGKTGTDEYKQAVLDLNQAEMNQVGVRRQLKNDHQAVVRNYREMTRGAKEAADQTDRYVEKLGGEGGTRRLFEATSRAAKAAGKTLKEYLEGSYRLSGKQKDRILEMAGALRAQESAQTRLRRMQELSYLATLNQERATRGLASIAQNAAGHFAALKRSIPKTAARIAVKYSDSGDAARVAKSASRALNAGVPKRVVTKIIADTKSADAAIARLRGSVAAIAAKRAAIKIGASDQASAKIAAIVGRVNGIKDKTARIRARDEAIPTIAKIISKIRGVPDKTARLMARDLITSAARSAQNALNALRDRTVTLTLRTVGRMAPGAGGQMRPTASGKPAGTPGYNAMIGEGGGPEWHVNRKKGTAYKTDGPMLTRLGRDDAIIPTEPKHRSRGREILTGVAKDLGVDMFAGGKPMGSGTWNGAAYSANLNVTDLSRRGSPFRFNTKKARKGRSGRAARRRVKKGLAPYTVSNPWGRHIKNLLEQQSDLEREASIRESTVQEPEDFITESKMPDGTTVYGLDQAAMDSYRTQVAHVREVYDSLTRVTAEIVQSIPKALQSFQAEKNARRENIRVLKREIAREERRSKRRGKGKTNQRVRDSASSRLKKLRPALSRENKLLSEASSSYEELSGEVQKEAGFDYREAIIERNALDREVADVGGKAQGQLSEARTNAADGGGGGGTGGGAGGDAPLSYGAQTMIRDTERGNLMREHGGNAYSTSPGARSAPGMGGAGGGMQVNPAYMGGSDTSGGSVTRSMAMGNYVGGGGAGFPTSGGGATAPVSDGGKTVNITNNFQTQPENPHLWSQGMAFEANTAF